MVKMKTRYCESLEIHDDEKIFVNLYSCSGIPNCSISRSINFISNSDVLSPFLKRFFLIYNSVGLVSTLASKTSPRRSPLSSDFKVIESSFAAHFINFPMVSMLTPSAKFLSHRKVSKPSVLKVTWTRDT